jgi:hypothetical protein
MTLLEVVEVFDLSSVNFSYGIGGGGAVVCDMLIVVLGVLKAPFILKLFFYSLIVEVVKSIGTLGTKFGVFYIYLSSIFE